MTPAELDALRERLLDNLRKDCAEDRTEAAAAISELRAQIRTMKASGIRDGKFLDSMWACKLCDGEIPGGHLEHCDLWKLEKKHRDFVANEHNAVLTERDSLRAELEAAHGEYAHVAKELEAAKAALAAQEAKP